MWKSRRQPNRYKRKKPTSRSGPLDLAAKVAKSGGPRGIALEEEIHQRRRGSSSFTASAAAAAAHASGDASVRDGIYGGRANRSLESSLRVQRLFSSPQQKRRDAAARSPGVATQASRRSRFSSRKPSGAASRSAAKSNSMLGANGAASSSSPAVHVVCCLSENLARETCVASMDAGAPVALHVTKQANGQTYAETLAYLEMLKPDEILVNEGRRTSQLVRKIFTFYQQQQEEDDHADEHDKENVDEDPRRRYGGARTSTVVKCVSRSLFDQTKGAEVLRNLAREETYDATVVEEYILLSSANALLHYMQQQLGASLSRKSLTLYVNTGGNQRMAIDRATLLQLELLVNNKTGKVKESLIGTIDRTKTTVGSRLLRTNLMSPPTNVDTIHARLELVDTFLSSEDFFYDTMDHLHALPDVDKMLSSIALIPKKQTLASSSSDHVRTGRTKEDVHQQRLASSGIGALVGIKSILSALPAFVQVLQKQLDFMQRAFAGDTNTGNCGEDDDDDGDEDGTAAHNNDVMDDTTIATNRTSLLIGLGGTGGGSTVPGSTGTQQPLASNHLLRAIVFAMKQPSLAELHEIVSEIFTETTTYSRNNHAMRHQECFALKSEPDGMLSVLRKAFLANVDDIYRKADEYAEVFGIRVNVKYTTARGYYLAVPGDVGSDLPNVFKQPTISGRYIHCTTDEITSLNSRAQDNVHDILLMTHEKIKEVLDVGRAQYDAIAALSDAIALLDMCHGFADHVTISQQQWSRPVVVAGDSTLGRRRQDHSPGGRGENSSNHSQQHLAGSSIDSGTTMIIRNGRYGIDVSNIGGANGAQEYIPNDTFASSEKCFTMISGINGSGKSTYLKQIAICTVLGHCGSYVPAAQASIPIRDMLCCRIGNADDQEHNISTFMLEMKEIAFICNHATEKSLILIDELGRATSNEDGVAIAWSIAEYLLKKQSMTFFVTHYPQLCRLEAIYPLVQNVHLEASLTRGANAEITYTHKVKAGSCAVCTDYGVELASLCGWPQDVYTNAQSLQQTVRESLPDDSVCSPDSNAVSKAFDSLRHLQVHLKTLTEDDSVQTFDGVRHKLSRLHLQFVRNPHLDLRHAIDKLLRVKSVRDTSSGRCVQNNCATRISSNRLVDLTAAENANGNFLPRRPSNEHYPASSSSSSSSSSSTSSMSSSDESQL